MIWYKIHIGAIIATLLIPLALVALQLSGVIRNPYWPHVIFGVCFSLWWNIREMRKEKTKQNGNTKNG